MNIHGIGVDIIEISRIKEAASRNPRIFDRLFTDKELADYRERGNRTETLAGKFAAKEAVVKALGTGLRGFPWTDLEILPDGLGKPCCHFRNKAVDALKRLQVSSVVISIAHNKTTAIANAMALKEEVHHEAGNQ